LGRTEKGRTSFPRNWLFPKKKQGGGQEGRKKKKGVEPASDGKKRKGAASSRTEVTNGKKGDECDV